jgi:preprotein translocase subunit SecD
VEDALKAGRHFENTGIQTDLRSIRVRAGFKDTDTQLQAPRTPSKRALNPDAERRLLRSVALNLVSNSPSLAHLDQRPADVSWASICAAACIFCSQVDMKGALTKRLDSTTADIRSQLRDKNVRHSRHYPRRHGTVVSQIP